MMAEFKCPDCNSDFLKKTCLNQHRKRAHGIVNGTKAQGKLKCTFCGKFFASERSLRRHRIQVHQQQSKKKNNIVCQEIDCTESFLTRSEFRNHLQNHHGCQNMADYEALKFQTKEEFDVWLVQEERQSKCSFRLERGEKTFKSHKTKHFVCCRSGQFKSVSLGKLQLKARVSKKIGFHCPAQVILKVFENEKIEVLYYKGHYKHDAFSDHQPSSTEEKNSPAGDTSITDLQRNYESMFAINMDIDDAEEARDGKEHDTPFPESTSDDDECSRNSTVKSSSEQKRPLLGEMDEDWSTSAALRDYLESRAQAYKNKNKDSISLFFDSIGETVRSFPLTVQVTVKNNIHNYVSQQALKLLPEYSQSPSQVTSEYILPLVLSESSKLTSNDSVLQNCSSQNFESCSQVQTSTVTSSLPQTQIRKYRTILPC